MSEVELAAEIEKEQHQTRQDKTEKPYPSQTYAWYVVAVLVTARS
jgi:hypothetical protein